MFGVLFV